MDVTFDPQANLTSVVTLVTPQVVIYRLWYKKPDDPEWTIYGDGNNKSSSHTHEVSALPNKSEIAYYFRFLGKENTLYRAKITFSQNGDQVGEPVVVEGVLDEEEVAIESAKVKLVASS